MNVAVVRRRTFAVWRWDAGDWIIARHVAGRARLVAAIWGLVFGLYVVATIEGFVKGFPTHAQRVQAVHSLQSFAILLGPLRQADTVAGFTSWRVLTAITFIGAIWGLLTSTGLLRGEEDAGRWELFLAGQTTKRRAAAQALVGLGSALATMFSVAAVVTILAGQLPAAHFSVDAALFFAVALVSGAALFLAIGALTSQLSATRGQAGHDRGGGTRGIVRRAHIRRLEQRPCLVALADPARLDRRAAPVGGPTAAGPHPDCRLCVGLRRAHHLAGWTS